MTATSPDTRRESLAPSPPAPGPSTLGSTVVAMVRTRLDLFQEELQEERDSVFGQLRLTIIGLATGFLAAIAAILWVGLALPPDYRLGVLGAITLSLGGIAVWTIRLRSRLKKEAARPFGRLMTQLARDVEVISSSAPENHS